MSVKHSGIWRLVVGMAVVGMALVGCGATQAPAAAGGGGSTQAQGEYNDADIAFAQGMIPHHQQAVDMAQTAIGRTENPRVLGLAQQIGEAQGPEIDTMTGWLQAWGASLSTGQGEHAGHGGGQDMGGMMTAEQMEGLMQTSGAEFDRMFLEGMIEHHRGAVQMAQAELQDGQDADALQLAQQIIDSQQAEIAEMESLLQ